MKHLFSFLGWACLFVLALVLIPSGAMAMPMTLTPSLDADELMFLGVAGLLVNKETISNVFISLKTTFNNAFNAAPTVWQKIAMKVTSTSGQNDYAWLSKFPKMRKWVGEKWVKALEAFKYTIVNDDYEATVEVNRNDIADDNLGIYGPQAKMAGESAAQLPDEIVMELVNGAFTNVCYDGQYFIDTDHPVADASVSNKLTVALSAASQAAARASYGAARTMMREFKDDEGRPLNTIPAILLVPPALEDVALALINNERLEDGKANLYKGTAEVVVDARLTSTTAWFLLDTRKPVMPFIYQEREAPNFVEQTGEDNDDVFMRKMYKFGAEARAAGGYGFWQLAVGSDGTT